ncbi:glycosyltransferase family 4 protein [Paenibacillus sabuli]|nr:glycosyltransferase [Paenibacillus sabuli]
MPKRDARRSDGDVARPRRIAFYNHTSDVSGAEISLLLTAGALQRAEPLLLAPEGELLRRAREAGLACMPLASHRARLSRNPLRLLGGALGMARAGLRLALAVRRARADAIHANSLRAGLMASAYVWLHRRPVLWHVRDMPPGGWIGRAIRGVAALTTSGIIGISEPVLAGMRSARLQGRLHLVHNGVALQPMDASRREHYRMRLRDELGAAGETMVAAIIGQIAPWKRQRDALLAAAELVRQGHDLQLWVVGEPKFRAENRAYDAELRQLARELGIAERVRFTGHRDDVDQLCCAIDLLLLCSDHEPFGRVLIEAMAQERPVVATRAGGVPEVVEDGGCGLLYAVGDVAGLTAAADLLLRDPELRRELGRRGAARVQARFTIAGTAKRVERIYAGLPSRRGGDTVATAPAPGELEEALYQEPRPSALARSEATTAAAASVETAATAYRVTASPAREASELPPPEFGAIDLPDASELPPSGPVAHGPLPAGAGMAAMAASGIWPTPERGGPRVAIVHDYLNQMGGAERVVGVLHRMFPHAPIYTTIADRARLLPELEGADIRTTWMQRIPGILRHFKLYFWLYPLAMRSLRLRGYDLVVSSSSAYAKAVRVPRGAAHLCYCYTPMRFAWDYEGYMAGVQAPRLAKAAARMMVAPLRLWDRRTTRRVDEVVAISGAIQARIARHYGREAPVIFPPVQVSRFPLERHPRGDYFLVVSRLVAYKRIDLAVQACTHLGAPLVVIGDGPDRARLEALAGPAVTFAGRLPDTEVTRYMAHCRALLFPGLEDFGITPLEANACGRPVVAFRGGGALDTITPGINGIFFDEQRVQALVLALEYFDIYTFDPERIRRHAEQFDEARFIARLALALEQTLRSRAMSTGQSAPVQPMSTGQPPSARPPRSAQGRPL